MPRFEAPSPPDSCFVRPASVRSSQPIFISGTDDSSRCVYSWWGGVSTSFLAPCSTMRPWNMTTISSEMARTVAKSWVMNM